MPPRFKGAALGRARLASLLAHRREDYTVDEAALPWLDRPDALQAIERKRRAGEISAEDAVWLEHFSREGYATFEAFVEREVDLGKIVALRLARVPEVFQEAAAKEHGIEAVLAAVAALETAAKPQPKRSNGPQRGGLPLKPPK